MQTSFKDMATRAANAEANFVEILMNVAGITEAEAEKVMNLYLKEKLAKLDYVNGNIRVKDGFLLDVDVIHNAAAL